MNAFRSMDHPLRCRRQRSGIRYNCSSYYRWLCYPFPIFGREETVLADDKEQFDTAIRTIAYELSAVEAVEFFTPQSVAVERQVGLEQTNEL